MKMKARGGPKAGMMGRLCNPEVRTRIAELHKQLRESG
jgi:hypothetical protein